MNLQQADALANAMLARGYGRRSMRRLSFNILPAGLIGFYSLLILGSAFITLSFQGMHLFIKAKGLIFQFGAFALPSGIGQ